MPLTGKMIRTVDLGNYPKINSLNALRLLMATLVIVSHAFPLAAIGTEPSLGGANLGTWAVFGFFAISGFLITRSRMSNTPRRYYRARFLRLIPGFVVALLVVAFVFAPASLLLDDTASYSWRSGVKYVLHNLPLYPPRVWQLGIDDTLATVPYPRVWDGPLWTLFWEAICYIVVGVMVNVLARKWLGPAMIGIALGLTALSAFGAALGHGGESVTMHVIALGITFAVGSLAFLYGREVRVWPVMAACVVILIPICALGQAMTLLPVPLTLILLLAGVVLPLHKVGASNDISYGMYIYGWPVQQTVVLGLGLSSVAYIVVTIVGTIPLAYLSCKIIEQPALRLKDHQFIPEGFVPRRFLSRRLVTRPRRAI